MQLISVADIIGGNAKVALGTGVSNARFMMLTPLGGNARLGDTNVSAAQGVSLVQNVPTLVPLDGADLPNRYSLASNFAYVPSGTTLTVSYGI